MLTGFTMKIGNNSLKKVERTNLHIAICHPPSWFYAVNRLENGSLGLIRTSLGLT